jgi:hypothetical protein
VGKGRAAERNKWREAEEGDQAGDKFERERERHLEPLPRFEDPVIGELVIFFELIRECMNKPMSIDGMKACQEKELVYSACGFGFGTITIHRGIGGAS